MLRFVGISFSTSFLLEDGGSSTFSSGIKGSSLREEMLVSCLSNVLTWVLLFVSICSSSAFFSGNSDACLGSGMGGSNWWSFKEETNVSCLSRFYTSVPLLVSISKSKSFLGGMSRIGTGSTRSATSFIDETNVSCFNNALTFLSRGVSWSTLC